MNKDSAGSFGVALMGAFLLTLCIAAIMIK